jgi:hypothetical protein
MTTSLFTGVCSIVPTKRRRFFWAAWWTAPPEAEPFRKPDGASGGARTREEAFQAAERAAGRSLTAIDGRWAGAWVRVLRGEPPFPKPRAEGAQEPRVAPSATPPREGSKTWALAVLGVAKGASDEEIKRAFRALALRTHPDHGGDEAAFIDAKRALDVALAGESRRKRR